MAAGLGDLRRPFGIIGQEQQAFACLVQPPYGTQPWQPGLQQVVNRLAPSLVGRGRDHAARFIHDEVDGRRFADRRTVDLNPVVNPVVAYAAIGHAHRAFRIPDDPPIPSNTSSPDQSRCPGPRAIAHLGNGSRQADSFLRPHLPMLNGRTNPSQFPALSSRKSLIKPLGSSVRPCVPCGSRFSMVINRSFPKRMEWGGFCTYKSPTVIQITHWRALRQRALAESSGVP